MHAADPELAFLLEAYRLRDPELSKTFDALARPIFRRMARKHGIGLPDDAIEEVVQEVFLGLLNPLSKAFDQSRGTVRQYLLGRVLNAVKTVQVGCGLRRAGSDFDREPQRQFLPLDDLEMGGDDPFLGEPLHARQMVRKIFSEAGADMERVCTRVWADRESQTAVASDLGISRFALARKLAAVKITSAKHAAWI
jgi:hypothetical protein